MSTELLEKAKALETKRAELGALFAAKKVNGELKLTDSDAEEIRSRNDELTTLAKDYEAVKAVHDIETANEDALKTLREPYRRHPAYTGEGDEREERRAIKSLGEQFIESAQVKGFRPGERVNTGFDLRNPYGPGVKATFTTSGATLTAYDRQPGIVAVEQQKLTVADLFARGETTMNTIRYVREDTYTNAATAVTEGSAKPEASWDTSEADAPVRKIAVVAKVTDELIADFPAIKAYIDERMPFMVRQREEALLLTGNGTPPNITGVLNTAGIQTQATGSDTNPDAIYKAITKVRTVGFFEPDAVVIHPNNWTPIRLLKTTTGEYVWGHPAESGPERIWGLIVDVTVGITANTGLVGAFKLGGQIFYREGIRIEMTNSNEDDFKTNLVAIRCEQREALAIYRPLAFCSVSSLGT